MQGLHSDIRRSLSSTLLAVSLDDCLVRDMRAAMAPSGYRVLRAKEPEAAAEMLSSDVHAVVVDDTLGTAAVASVVVTLTRAGTPSALVLSCRVGSANESQMRALAAECRADGFVEKPVHRRSLEASMSLALAIARQRRTFASWLEHSDAACGSPAPTPASTGEAFLRFVERELFSCGPLSVREKKAIALAIRGWSKEAAAEELGCAVNTYRNHLYNGLRKTGAESLADVLRVVARRLDTG